VSLGDDEGGMNLTMPQPVIDALTKRGRAAGAKLVRRYSEERTDGEPLSWRDHRWTRLRIAMPAVAELLTALADSYEAPPAGGQRGYAELMLLGHGPPYEMADGRRERARHAFARVADLGEALRAAEDAFADGRPAPPPAARMVPPD
jgi:hypothetical protein